jgi:hypothetical protein
MRVEAHYSPFRFSILILAHAIVVVNKKMKGANEAEQTPKINPTFGGNALSHPG